MDMDFNNLDDFELKLKGELPVTREEFIDLASSWGRTDDFITQDGIKIEKCEPKECYNLENLDVSQIIDYTNIFVNSLYNGKTLEHLKLSYYAQIIKNL